ncbi:SDR family oxidoreductase [Bacillus sp. FJAT-27245]|uniref:SDR family oxidoreductase n=1 Tax=Bacillus sp. FJAT-27245 TaxID=1684144 RepID=UPI0006A77117|nr:SDR family oxidoreductase [Bacillus sp. FJAT-27245]
MKILVTGATGKLGSALVDHLRESDNEIRLTSRKRPEYPGIFEWVYCDLKTGEGITDALKDVDVVLHAATSPLRDSTIIEVTGFERFLKEAGHVKHFIYPSIVGIEDIPMRYYKLKCEAEDLLKNSPIPYSIVRGTQFHHFVDQLFLSKPLLKRYILPGKFKFQSVDVSDFARHLIDILNAGPQGKSDDFGGPELLTLKEMALMKAKAMNEPAKVISIPIPGKLSNAFINGKNTNKAQKRGKTTFGEYLKKSGI